MSLGVNNVTLLTLTARKADCELGISLDAAEKMALTRQQSELTREYYARLQGKNIAYYANGQYNAMDYNYLMGNTTLAATDIISGNTAGMKKDASMVLTDANGLVVMSDSYASILKSVLGASCMDADGRGGTFSKDKIPALIAQVAGAYATEDEIKAIIDGGKLESNYNVSVYKTKSQDLVSTGQSHDNTDSVTSKVEAIVNYFYPIFMAAASNGWTTEYNKEMANNQNYISDALVSGIFNLEQVDQAGQYLPDASLSYFTTAGLVVERTDSSIREAITAWYNSEKEAINEKESWIDLDIQDLSTELEAINTEIQSIKSMQEDDMKMFEFANG